MMMTIITIIIINNNDFNNNDYNDNCEGGRQHERRGGGCSHTQGENRYFLRSLFVVSIALSCHTISIVVIIGD